MAGFALTDRWRTLHTNVLLPACVDAACGGLRASAAPEVSLSIFLVLPHLTVFESQFEFTPLFL